MGKIKSAIITAILVAAIVVLTLFATVTCTVPGNNGVKRYNSFINTIHLGSDLTGEARTVLYPDGVITETEYKFSLPEADDDRYEAYVDKYEKYVSSSGSVYYIEKEAIEDGLDSFKASVASDAKNLSARFGKKAYSSYSVAVQDDVTISVTVPTNFSYAAYKQNDSTARSSATSEISQSLQYLAYGGELSLRNSEIGKAGFDNILTPLKADITSYFKGASKASSSGNYGVKIKLTSEGRQLIKEISNKLLDASEDNAIGFYVGDAQLLSLTVSSVIDESSFYITVSAGESIAEDYAIVLNSVMKGETLALDYNTDENLDIVYTTAALGDYAAIYLAVALLLVIVAAMVYSVVRYKKLGLVNVIIIAIYSLAMLIALMLLEIQLTLAGAFTAVLGLALVCGVNFAQFEAVRGETKKGKTMQSSVKSGYKGMLTSLLDLHIILFVVALLLTLVAKGELAACGFIFLIATVASYILYWFTRFMWYVISSPVKDKFKFGGFKREELLDD